MFYLPFLVDFEFDLAGFDLIGPKVQPVLSSSSMLQK